MRGELIHTLAAGAPLNRKARRAEAARLKIRPRGPTCACCRPAADDGHGDHSGQNHHGS